MRRHAILTILLLLCAAMPARAYELDTHILAGDIIIPRLNPGLRDIIKKNKKQYQKGITEEKELFEEFTKKNGEFNYANFKQMGMDRVIYHVQRIQSFMDKKTKRDLLAYEVGQYVRCVMDLLEPYPESKDYGPLEIAGNRAFFIEDFKKNNKKFDYMFDGRTYIKNMPSALDDILKKNTADAEKIYKIYHSERSYKKADNPATACFNRTLNFAVDSLNTFDEIMRSSGGQKIDIRTVLGLDNLSKYGSKDSSSDIKKPDAPNKPKAPTPPK